MNITQLERIKKMITNIYAELEAHPEGIATIFNSVTDLEIAVTHELKNQVWIQSLEADG